jgi:uncharacterized protein (TIGR03546 family)
MKPLRFLLGFSRRVQQTQGVALAVMLGLLAGFVGGWNLSLLALLLLAVVFNVRARTFFVMWASGYALSWVLVPISFGLGRWLLDSTQLGQWLAANFDEQLIAWLGWDRYTLVGGSLLAVVLAVPTLLAIRAWRRSNVRVAQGANQQSAKLATDGSTGSPVIAAAVVNNSSPSAGAKLAAACSRFLGTDVDVLAGDTATANTGLIRPWALWGLVAGLMMAGLCAWLLAPRIVANHLMEVLTWANGAEVAATRISVTPWTGNVEIHGLTAADPTLLDQDRLRIGHLRGRVDMAALARGRLAVENMQMTGITTGANRERTASVVRTSGPENELPAATEAAAEEASTALGQELTLGDCIDSWGLAQDNAQRLDDLIHGLAEINALDTVARRQPLSLAEQRAARSPLGKNDPRVNVHEMLVEGFPQDWRLGSDTQLRITDLASGGDAVTRPTRVVVRIPQHAIDLRVTLASHEAVAAGHLLEFHIFDLPAVSLLAPPSGRQRLVCESGMITVAGRGQITRRGLALAGTLRADRLSAQIIGGEPLGGLEPEVWNQALAAIGRLQTTFVVRGTLTQPALHLEPTEVAQHVEAELRSVGQHRLAAHITQCLTGRAPQGEGLANQAGELVGNEWLGEQTVAGPATTADPTAMANAGAAIEGAPVDNQQATLEEAPVWGAPCAEPADALRAPTTTSEVAGGVVVPLPPEIAEAVLSDQPPVVEYTAQAPANAQSRVGPDGRVADASPVAMPEAPNVSVRFSPPPQQGPGAIDLVTGQDPADRPAPVAYRQVTEPREPASEWPADRVAQSTGRTYGGNSNPAMQPLPEVPHSSIPAEGAAPRMAAGSRADGDPFANADRPGAIAPGALPKEEKPAGWSKKLSNWSRNTLAQTRELVWPFGKEKLPAEPTLNGDEWPSESSWREGSKIERNTASMQRAERAEGTVSADRSAADKSRASASRENDSRGKRKLR